MRIQKRNESDSEGLTNAPDEEQRNSHNLNSLEGHKVVERMFIMPNEFMKGG